MARDYSLKFHQLQKSDKIYELLDLIIEVWDTKHFNIRFHEIFKSYYFCNDNGFSMKINREIYDRFIAELDLIKINIDTYEMYLHEDMKKRIEGV